MGAILLVVPFCQHQVDEVDCANVRSSRRFGLGNHQFCYCLRGGFLMGVQGARSRLSLDQLACFPQHCQQVAGRQLEDYSRGQQSKRFASFHWCLRAEYFTLTESSILTPVFRAESSLVSSGLSVSVRTKKASPCDNRCIRIVVAQDLTEIRALLGHSRGSGLEEADAVSLAGSFEDNLIAL